ncbi:MAG: hypothetical protein WC676_00825 [Candidatus Omnitrophota bacterium]
MKKCDRCDIVFHSGSRLTCLYCDSILFEVEASEALKIQEKTLFKKQIDKTQKASNQDHAQYLVGSYFRARSFAFMYSFSRNQLKMGKAFKRFLIQPINFSFVIRIPWLVINLLDSMMIHMEYQKYCAKCDWKYRSSFDEKTHLAQECEFNQEYTSILNRILTGDIVKDEELIEKAAQEKLKLGKRSAYFQLCSRKNTTESVLDIFIILFSMSLIVYVVVKTFMPIFGNIYDF